MADVYRATDRVLGRQVAVKVLRTSVEAAAAARARFDAEPVLLAALSHPGLVMVLDAGADVQDAYLVMELLDGPTLSARLRDRGPMDADEVAALGAALADALASAHQRGVVHRDVKPSNIVLCEGRPVLTDFGIARYVSDAADLTAAGEVIGSPAYLAPEQVNGLDASPAVDVYALGLVLLEAYTGTRAYPGPPLEAAVARLTVPPAIPVSLDRPTRALLTRMLATDPAARPSMTEVSDALRSPASAPAAEHTAVLDLAELTQAAGSAAEPESEPEEIARERRRRPLALVAAAAVALACLGLVAVDQLTPDEVAAVEEPPTSPSATPSATPFDTPTATPVALRTPAADKAAADKAAAKPKAKPAAKPRGAGSKGKAPGQAKKKRGKPGKGR